MIHRLTNIPNNHFVLSIFRLILGFHLLKKITFWWPNLELLLSKKSFVVIEESTRFMSYELINFFAENYRLLVFFHVLLILFVIFGIGKNISVLFLYLTVEIIQRISGGLVLNGGDNFLKFALLYMVFCNSFEYFILRGRELKRNFVQNHWFKNLCTNVFSKSIIIHLVIIYFVSGFYKANTDVWVNGVANYYIFQLERFKAGYLNEWIVSKPLLIMITTYLTLFWELLFPIVLFNKKARNLFLLIGFLFHIGIYFLMLINDFALLFIMSYILFFNDKEVLRFIIKTKRFRLKNIFYGKSRLFTKAN